MKKLLFVSAVLLLSAASVFAQTKPAPAPAPGANPPVDYTSPRGMMHMELGTQVIHEYKKLTGTLLVSDRLIPALKTADGTEFVLMVPMKAWYAINPKQGDAVSLEGLTIIVKKADGKTEYYLRPVKGTVGGKDFDLGRDMPGRMGRGDHDRDDWGPGPGRGGPGQGGQGGPGMGPGMMGPRN